MSRALRRWGGYLRAGFDLPLRLRQSWAPAPALVLWALSPAVQAEAGGSAGLVSVNLLRGMDLSESQPSALLDGHYRWRGGRFAGMSVTSVRDSGQDGAQLVLYGGQDRALAGDWRMQTIVTHYQTFAVPRSVRVHYDELSAALVWRDRLSFSAAAAPNFGAGDVSGAAWGADIMLTQPVGSGFVLTAGLGYFNAEVVGFGYGYGSAGVLYSLRRWQFGLMTSSTDAASRRRLPMAYQGLVASVMLNF